MSARSGTRSPAHIYVMSALPIEFTDVWLCVC